MEFTSLVLDNFIVRAAMAVIFSACNIGTVRIPGLCSEFSVSIVR